MGSELIPGFFSFMMIISFFSLINERITLNSNSKWVYYTKCEDQAAKNNIKTIMIIIIGVLTECMRDLF